MKAIGRPVQLPAIQAVCSRAAFVTRTAIAGTLGVCVLAGTLAAQTALTAAAEGRTGPGGTSVMSIHAGAQIAVVTRKEDIVFVNVDGWVDASRLAGKVDTFPASVDTKTSLRLRASASGTAPVLAELHPRTGVLTLGKSGTWTHVKRGVWIPAAALPKVAAPVAAAKAPAKSAPALAQQPPAAVQDAAPVPQGAMSVSKPTKLLTAPGATPIGELATGAIVTPLAHDHGFAKVRIEGWVPERDLAPADSSQGSRITAADLRADPEGMRGRLVQWEVEILSMQTADPLRRELARDEPYLLAKGPGAESALLYLAVPPSLLNQAKALAPLTRVLITARVRVGRSEPVGTPILDLKSISKR